MKPVFRPTTPSDEPRLIEFFQRVFGSAAGPNLLTPAHMHWKYWTPRPDWDGSRSYVVERDGRILSHGAAWPLRLCAGEKTKLSGFFLFDWAADPASPGMGTAVFSKMAQLVDLVWVAGGTSEANRMRAANGFRKVRPVFLCALPLRPARMELTRKPLNWKTMARLSRNLVWRMRLSAPATGWTAAEVSELRLIPAGRNGFDFSREFASYLAKCPAAGIHWFEVRRNGEPAGFFTLLKVPGQARLAEASVPGGGKEAWRNLAFLAARTALAWDGVNEITVLTSLEEYHAGLREAGFQLRETEDVMVFDPKNQLGDASFDFQLLQGDMAFLHQGRPAYLC